MVSCLCPYRRLVKVVEQVSQAVLVFALSVALVVVVAHVAQAASSPDPVLCEPEAVVVDVVALRRVHRVAAAVALAAPDVQLALHEPDVQRAAAAGVAVARPHEAV